MALLSLYDKISILNTFWTFRFFYPPTWFDLSIYLYIYKTYMVFCHHHHQSIPTKCTSHAFSTQNRRGNKKGPHWNDFLLEDTIGVISFVTFTSFTNSRLGGYTGGPKPTFVFSKPNNLYLKVWLLSGMELTYEIGSGIFDWSILIYSFFFWEKIWWKFKIKFWIIFSASDYSYLNNLKKINQKFAA